MSNVTPIRPAPPPTTPRGPYEIRVEAQRIWEAASVMELAEHAIDSFSGDEDSVAIVYGLTAPSSAICCARNLLLEIAERLEEIAREQEARPA